MADGMSAETKAALEDALRAHVIDEGEGSYLTDWVILAAGAVADDPDATMYISECSAGPIHHRIGLARYLVLKYDEQLMADDDDE